MGQCESLINYYYGRTVCSTLGDYRTADRILTKPLAQKRQFSYFCENAAQYLSPHLKITSVTEVLDPKGLIMYHFGSSIFTFY